MHLRVLTVADLRAYRDLHRFALEESPQAFVETLANDDVRSDDVVAAMLARGEAWGLFEGERLLGKLVIDALPYDCLSHTYWLHAVYVHPDARGRGGADMLAEAAIGAARQAGASRFALWVNVENAAARRFYERLGFRETGRIPQGIRVGERYVDDVLMCLAADAPARR